MKYDVRKCEIIEKKQLTETAFSFVVKAEDLAEITNYGQFANISVPTKTLRRPISICDFDKENSTLRFVFEIRGEGTKILADFNEGDFIDILAPLGNGFKVEDTNKKVLLIGGGIGVPPLLSIAKAYGENATAVIGFRNKDAAILVEDFQKTGCKLIVATDDGSMGHHGLVTECIDDVIADEIMACGPMPMLKSICKVAEDRGINAQISLEERMACGIGACLGCACKTRKEDEDGNEKEVYGHVCKNGPVFDYKEIVF